MTGFSEKPVYFLCPHRPFCHEHRVPSCDWANDSCPRVVTGFSFIFQVYLFVVWVLRKGLTQSDLKLIASKCCDVRHCTIPSLNSDLNSLISRWETKPCLDWPVAFCCMKLSPSPLRGALCSHQHTRSSREQNLGRLSNLPLLSHKYFALPEPGVASMSLLYKHP